MYVKIYGSQIVGIWSEGKADLPVTEAGGIYGIMMHPLIIIVRERMVF